MSESLLKVDNELVEKIAAVTSKDDAVMSLAQKTLRALLPLKDVKTDDAAEQLRARGQGNYEKKAFLSALDNYNDVPLPLKSLSFQENSAS